VPVTSAVNNQGDGTLFDRSEFHYDEQTDTFRCPANQTMTRKQLSRHDRACTARVNWKSAVPVH
jgi:hypothetical protein